MKFSNLTFFSSITKGKIRGKKKEKKKRRELRQLQGSRKITVNLFCRESTEEHFCLLSDADSVRAGKMLRSEFLSSSRGVWRGPFAPTLVTSVKVGNKSLPLPQLPFCLCQAPDISYLSFSTGQASLSHACLLRGSLLDYNFCVLSAFSCSGFSLLSACPCCPQYYHTDRNKHFSSHWLQAASGSLPVMCAGIQSFPNI